MASANNFLSEEEQERIIAAITEAEKNTSGEIRVHIENNCSGNPLLRAEKLFLRLGMNKTEQRNGVLIYLAIKDKKFAIAGDKGIDEAVPENFWNEVRDLMQSHFREQHFVQGLCEGIGLAGEQLKKYFPYLSDDLNELTDEISFGDKHD